MRIQIKPKIWLNEKIYKTRNDTYTLCIKSEVCIVYPFKKLISNPRGARRRLGFLFLPIYNVCLSVHANLTERNTHSGKPYIKTVLLVFRRPLSSKNLPCHAYPLERLPCLGLKNKDYLCICTHRSFFATCSWRLSNSWRANEFFRGKLFYFFTHSLRHVSGTSRPLPDPFLP